jgi:hypothetical protein
VQTFEQIAKIKEAPEMLRLFLQAYVVEPDFATQFINEWVKKMVLL